MTEQVSGKVIFDLEEAELNSGDKSLVRIFLHRFAEELPKYMIEIESKADSGCVDDLKLAAHTLKGSASFVVAESIKSLSNDVCDACTAGQQKEDILLLVRKLQSEVNEAKDELKRILDSDYGRD